MPTFTYEQVTPATYRVLDTDTREVYGVIYRWPDCWGVDHPALRWESHLTRDDAAHALYTAHYARGFEAGAL